MTVAYDQYGRMRFGCVRFCIAILMNVLVFTDVYGWCIPGTKYASLIDSSRRYFEFLDASFAAYSGELINSEYDAEDLYIPDTIEYTYKGTQYKWTVVLVGSPLYEWRGKNISEYNKACIDSGFLDEDSWYYGEDNLFCGYDSNRKCPVKRVFISDNVVEIAEVGFGNWNSLEEIHLPQNIRTIRGETFVACCELREINIPNLVTNIGHHAFSGCTNLSSVIWPRSSFRIQPGAFSQTGFKTVVIPDWCTDISDSSGEFNGYTSVIHDGSFPVRILNTPGVFAGCENLTDVKMPANIKRVPSYFVERCPKLRSFNFSGISGIGKGAFWGTGFQNLVIPNNVTNISDYAFGSCPDLETVRFEGRVTAGSQIFQGCSNLKTVFFLGLPPSVKNKYPQIFQGVHPDAVGYYSPEYADEWEAVLDADGKWQGLKMGPAQYTVIYDMNNGSGETTKTTAVRGTTSLIGDFTLIWEGHFFMGWAFEDAGGPFLGSRDAVPEPQKGNAVTLKAQWATFEPELADWKNGSITLKATNVGVKDGELAWLSYCDANADNPSWEYADKSEYKVVHDNNGNLFVTDSCFTSRLGGMPAVKYKLQIGKSLNDVRAEMTCTTRTKCGIFVGVGEFGDAYGDNKPDPLFSCPKSAEKFCKLMKEQGRLTDETSRLLTDGLATYENVDKAFSDFAKVVKPGDVCVVYFSTHGGLYQNSTTGYLYIYDKPPPDVDPKRLGYNENLLAHHIRMLDRDEKGVAVVNVISACHSGAFFNDSSEDMICRAATYWCQKEHLNPANIVWITAADYNTIAMTYFDNFLLDYGWEGGWADTKKEGVISFLDLANYTKLQYDKLFKFKSNIFFKDEDDSRKVQIVDEHNILGKIIAGKCKVHADADPPSSPSVSASQGTFSDKIELKGDNSSDAWYCIFYRFGERMYWAGNKPVGGFPFDFKVLLDSQKYSGEYDDFLSTTSSSPMHFIVKAVNGAGISEESTEQLGWVNSQMKKVVFDGNEGMLPNKWDGVSPRGPKGSKWVLKGNVLGNVPNPEHREGFRFVGWFNGSDAAKFDTIIQENVTYAAKWMSEKQYWLNVDADAKARNMTILYREVVGTSSSAFELAIDDDCNVSATGEMADGSPIEVRSSIERIVDDEAEIPLTWTDKNGAKIGMVIRISKSGKVTIKDGGYTRDGVPVEIEVIPEFGLLIKDGVLIGYEGEMPDGYEMIVPDEVTEIGANAFRDCSNLKSVSLSAGLDRIEYGAFCECSGLLEINLPAGLTSIGEHAFSSSGLVDVSIPDSVTNVGANAFCICQNLMEVSLGGNLLGLSKNVFGSCFSLAKVNFGGIIKFIGDYSFFQDYGLSRFTIPDGMEEIGEYAFCSCGNLREVLIPKSVNSIGQGAFMNCGSLSTICVEEGDEDRVRGLLSDSGLDVTSIMFVHEGEFTLNISEDGCLEGCAGWLPDSYDLVIPEGVRQINGYALSGLPIRSVHIPESCTWIGEGAFSDCEDLMVVTGGDGLEYVATRAFEGTPFMEDGEDEPEVAYVGRCAVGLRRSWMLDEMYSESDPDKWSYELNFRDGTVCVSGFSWLPITSVVFPDSVETIASDAFSKCDLLREVSFGENLREIEFGAFQTWDTPYDVWDTPEDTDRTPEIMELYFPAGLEYVGGDAFAGWDNLQTAYFEGRIGDWWTEGFPEGCELVSLTIQKLIVEDGIVKGLIDVVDKTGRESGDIVDGVLVLPDGVTAIDDFALSDAPIRTVVIPESCKRIGEYALAWCYDLERVIGGDGVESVGYSAFEGSCLFDDWADEFGLVYVGKCLVGCRGRSVLQAQFDAFEGDEWRYDLIIKDGITSAGGLENLPFTSVILPDSVVSIDDYAFQCYSGWGWDEEPGYGVLERVELGKGVRTIGDMAFWGCEKLSVVSGGDNVENVGYYAFGNTGILPVDDDGAFEVVYVGSVAIGCRGRFPQGTSDDECCLAVREGTTAIAESAFSVCTNIRVVSLPDSLKTVPANAFNYCTNLKNVSLGGGVETIEDSAFANTAISAIDLPSNVRFVGAYAFGAYDHDFGAPEGYELNPTLEEVVFRSDQIRFDSSAFLCRTTTFDIDAEMEFVDPEVAFGVGVLRSVRMELEGFELRGWRRKAADDADRAGNGNFGVDELSEAFGIEGEWVWDDVTGWDDYVPYWVAPCVCPVGSPVVVGDDAARVTGDKESGFTIVPSEGVEDVVISVPSEVSVEKVVVELSPEVRSVVPNGATIRIMRGADDITPCLNIPPHDGSGRINLVAATVKEEIVREALDPSKDAVIELNAANPQLITVPTHKGLFYQLREGATLDGMKNGDSTIGDGKPWSPEITVKGGNSAFYSIGVGKGE